jgi:hypothetical protein
MIKRKISIICVSLILILPVDTFASDSLAKKVMVDALYGAGIGVTVGFMNGFARAAVPGETYNPRRQAGDMLGGLVLGAVIGAAYGLITGPRDSGREAPVEKTAANIIGTEDGRVDVKDFPVPWKTAGTKINTVHHPY